MGRHTATAVGRPLVVTSDEHLLDQLLRLAAAAGVDVDVAPDAGAARESWSLASVILLDDALASEAASAGLTRRAEVIVIGRDLDDAAVWRRAVTVGADHVVFLPEAADWLIERILSGRSGAGSAQVVTVISASGGAGASTLAAAVALRAVGRHLSPVLVDADPGGGGIDLLLGAEQAHGVRWGDLSGTEGSVEQQVLLDALPVDDGLPFLSWSRDDDTALTAAAYDCVLSSLTRHDGLVVVDVGRAAGMLPQAAIAVTTTAVLLVPARVRAVAAATALVQRNEQLRDRMVVVVRRASSTGLDAATVAQSVALPLLGTLPHDPRSAEWEDNGLPPRTRGAWQRVADAIIDREAKGVSAA